MEVSQSVNFIEQQTSVVKRSPYSEGNNIMSWLGFKHIMYLAEEAVLEHFKNAGTGFRSLLEDDGLVIDIIENKGRILHALKLDEDVSIIVQPAKRKIANAFAFDIKMLVSRSDKEIKTYTGHIKVVLKHDQSLGFKPVEKIAPAFLPYVTEQAALPNMELKTFDLVPAQDIESQIPCLTENGHRIIWEKRIPYFYCHGNERLKMSGYLRLMEEADELFCHQQGISIKSLLDEKRWIPAVPSANMTILSEVLMEETLYISYEVKDFVKDLTYKSTMTCYLKKNDKLVEVAKGEIVHAYAVVHDRTDWSMVTLDEKVMNSLVS